MNDAEGANRVIRIEAVSPTEQVVERGASMGSALPPLDTAPGGEEETTLHGRTIGYVAPGEADMGETMELREEIEQTRSELAETINAIQERLNPQHLMEQARDTAQGTAEHLLDQAKETAREAAADAVDHAREAVREATIGKVEHMVSNASDTVKDAVSGVTDTARGLVGGSAGTTTWSSSNADNAGNATGGIGPTIVETIKQNPVPAALAAVGIGWLVVRRAKGPSTGQTLPPAYASSTSTPTSVQAGRIGTTTSTQNGSPLRDAVGSVGDTAGHAAGQVGNTAGQVAGQVGNTAGQVAGQVGNTVGRVGNTAGQVAGQVGETAQGLVQGTQQQAQQAQSQFQQLLQENPLAVGAMSIALGAAIGLAIPETDQERALMGGAHDSLVEKAGSTAQQTLQKVGHVAAEAGNAAKQEARDEGLIGG